MAHRYGQAILVRRASGLAGAPGAFHWRGVWYQVDAVLDSWRLRDRWWAAPLADVADVTHADAMSMPPADVVRPTERTYYRVLCRDREGEQVFDLYCDAASGQWILDRAHD